MYTCFGVIQSSDGFTNGFFSSKASNPLNTCKRQWNRMHAMLHVSVPTPKQKCVLHDKAQRLESVAFYTLYADAR
jgi:hypothetical protein